MVWFHVLSCSIPGWFPFWIPRGQDTPASRHATVPCPSCLVKHKHLFRNVGQCVAGTWPPRDFCQCYNWDRGLLMGRESGIRSQSTGRRNGGRTTKSWKEETCFRMMAGNEQWSCRTVISNIVKQSSCLQGTSHYSWLYLLHVLLKL